MPVKIRLMRVGKKKQPSYRMVVADARSPRDGRCLDIVGRYQPREELSRLEVDGEKILAWLRKGAQPTGQVHRLLVGAGVWERYEAGRASPSAPARAAAASARRRDEARAAPSAAAPPEEQPAGEQPAAPAAPETQGAEGGATPAGPEAAEADA